MNVIARSEGIDIGAILLPGRRHRETAGDEPCPELASHRKRPYMVKWTLLNKVDWYDMKVRIHAIGPSIQWNSA